MGSFQGTSCPCFELRVPRILMNPCRRNPTFKLDGRQLVKNEWLNRV
jgi:hypothetical protein